MTIRLKLLCHAPNAAIRQAGFPADEPLDDKVRARLADLPHNLHRADRCFVSPSLRTRQTAEALNLDAAIEPLLDECDYGRWAGRAFADVQADEAEAVANWLRAPDAAPHGGESLQHLLVRVAHWLDTQKETSGLTVAITHASVIRAAIVHAVEAGPAAFWRIDVAPLSLTRLNGDGRRWTLASIGPLRAEAPRQ